MLLKYTIQKVNKTIDKKYEDVYRPMLNDNAVVENIGGSRGGIEVTSPPHSQTYEVHLYRSCWFDGDQTKIPGLGQSHSSKRCWGIT